MLLIRPAAAHRVTVFGSTRNRLATSPGVSRRSRASTGPPQDVLVRKVCTRRKGSASVVSRKSTGVSCRVGGCPVDLALVTSGYGPVRRVGRTCLGPPDPPALPALEPPC